MAQVKALEGQKVRNLKTGEIVTAKGMQEFKGGVKGQFFNPKGYELITAAKPTVLPKVESPVKADDFGKMQTEVLATDIERKKSLDRVKQSVQSVGAQAKANEAFIQGVAQARYGRPATADELKRVGEGKYGLIGATVGDVLGRFGLTEVLPDHGIKKPEIDTEVSKSTQESFSDKTNDRLPQQQKTVAQQATEAREETKSASDLVLAQAQKLATVRQEAKDKAIKDVKLVAKSEEVSRVETELNDIRTQLQDTAVGDIRAEIDTMRKEGEILDRPLLASVKAGRLQNLSREERLAEMDRNLDTMLVQNQYNNKLVELQIAQGNYDRAQSLVQQTADTAYENQMLMLNYYALSSNMANIEYNRLNQDLQYERELALGGYVELRTPEEINKVGTDNLFRDPVTGKSYKKPEVAIDLGEDVKTKFDNINGQVTMITYNEKTGEIINQQGLGGAYKASSSGGGGGVTKFTSQEQRKLEQAGLIDSAREEQLNYLYGSKEPTEIEKQQTFYNDLVDLQKLGYDKKEAWGHLTDQLGELNEQEIKVFKEVFGNFWGSKPGWG